MDVHRMNTRTHVEIDGRDFILGHDRDLVAVMSSIERAAGSPPGFVDISAGDELVSVLITSASKVVVTVVPDTIPADWTPPGTPISDWELQ